MKKLVVSILVLALILAGCGAAAKPEGKFVGKRKQESIKMGETEFSAAEFEKMMGAAGQDANITIEILADKTAKFNMPPESQEGTWALKDDNTLVIDGGETDLGIKYADGKLVIEDEMKMVLVKE